MKPYHHGIFGVVYFLVSWFFRHCWHEVKKNWSVDDLKKGLAMVLLLWFMMMLTVGLCHIVAYMVGSGVWIFP